MNRNGLIHKSSGSEVNRDRLLTGENVEACYFLCGSQGGHGH